jgi:hypothetical protein|tara:strand:+ start:495 stop:596 length:102 start_codon:yes stop_codon:yes gene_type:complete
MREPSPPKNTESEDEALEDSRLALNVLEKQRKV